jgi:sulfonate transport system substrate-binding protein
MKRRTLLQTAAIAAPAALAMPGISWAASAGTLKIGYQKSSTALVLLKHRGWLEQKLKPLGYDVTWAEFPSGPPMLEALSANAVNFAFTGETPPIFSQASGTQVIYAANTVKHPHEEAVFVKASSTITSVAALKGKKVAVQKGSSSHYLLVASVIKAGLAFSDITAVYLAPSDARAAFQSGDVDAWAIWDPFWAAAQAGAPTRTLTDAQGVVPNRSFYLSRKDFGQSSAAALNVAIAEVAQIDAWIPEHKSAAAAEISPSIGLSPAILLSSFDRATYGVSKVTPDVLADQQKLADLFYKLNLIPAPITVADAAWS